MAIIKTRPFIPQTMGEVHQLAQAIAKSGMAPRGMDTPEKITIAILHGLEIGLPPMQAVQRIAVINGRPTIPAEPALGIIRASGSLEWISERIEGEGDKRVAVCEMKRRGEPDPIVGRFSVADAKKARLWDERETSKRYDKQKGGWADGPNDSPWFRFPERMLQMRARGFACRDGFGDVLGGLYLKEELEEGKPQEQPPDPGLTENPLNLIRQASPVELGAIARYGIIGPATTHDPETGEITTLPPDPGIVRINEPVVKNEALDQIGPEASSKFGVIPPVPDEPFLHEIIEHGDKVCVRGTKALQEWWASFSPDVRKAIGRNRIGLWKEKAEDAEKSK